MTSSMCETIRRAIVSDAPEEMAELNRHALACADCAAFVEQESRLLEAAVRWREESVQPPAALERRIAAAITREAMPALRLGTRRAPGARGAMWHWHWRWAATAALVVVALLGITGLVQRIRSLSTPETELARAVRQADEAQRSYAEAITRLDRQAAVVLARAGDPSLSSRQAAVLLTYRDRLAHLDSVIAETEGFLQDNPGHSGGHTVLLAAYKEKSSVLREVLDLKLGDHS